MKQEIKGKLTIIAGPMFSGKTEELIRLATRLKIGNKKIIVFKPQIDSRYDKNKICSHSGSMIECVLIKDPIDILTFLESSKEIEYIAIDEIQFLNNVIIDVVSFLIGKGYNVIASGLDMNFRGEPFGPMPELLCMAENVFKLTAVCNECGKDAAYTQRIVFDKPASYDDPIILVGAKEHYEARCREHHVVPGKKYSKKLSLKEGSIL